MFFVCWCFTMQFMFSCSQDWQLRGVLHHGGHLHPRLRLARHRPGLHLEGQGGGVGGRPHLPLLPHPGLRRVRRRQGLPGCPVLSGRFFLFKNIFSGFHKYFSPLQRDAGKLTNKQQQLELGNVQSGECK